MVTVVVMPAKIQTMTATRLLTPEIVVPTA
jgi:hypothetical protein